MGSWQCEDYYIKRGFGTIPTFETKEESGTPFAKHGTDTLDTMSKKSVEEPAIEKFQKQPAPKIITNAVNFHITDDALEQVVRKRNSDEI